jgi:hypothetical protein
VNSKNWKKKGWLIVMENWYNIILFGEDGAREIKLPGSFIRKEPRSEAALGLQGFHHKGKVLQTHLRSKL